MWRERKLCTLFIGMHIGKGPMENSMEVPEKRNTELPYDATKNTHIQKYRCSKEMKSGSWREVCTPVFISALLIVGNMKMT